MNRALSKFPFVTFAMSVLWLGQVCADQVEMVNISSLAKFLSGRGYVIVTQEEFEQRVAALPPQEVERINKLILEERIGGSDESLDLEGFLDQVERYAAKKYIIFSEELFQGAYSLPQYHYSAYSLDGPAIKEVFSIRIFEDMFVSLGAAVIPLDDETMVDGSSRRLMAWYAVAGMPVDPLPPVEYVSRYESVSDVIFDRPVNEHWGMGVHLGYTSIGPRDAAMEKNTRPTSNILFSVFTLPTIRIAE